MKCISIQLLILVFQLLYNTAPIQGIDANNRTNLMFL